MKSEFCLNFYVLQSQDKSTLSKDPISAIQQNGGFFILQTASSTQKNLTYDVWYKVRMK